MKRQSAVFFSWLCGLGGVIRLGGESAVFNCRIPRNLVTNSNTLAIFDERGWPMPFSPFFPLFLHVLCRCTTLWVVTDLNLSHCQSPSPNENKPRPKSSCAGRNGWKAKEDYEEDPHPVDNLKLPVDDRPRLRNDCYHDIFKL